MCLCYTITLLDCFQNRSNTVRGIYIVHFYQSGDLRLIFSPTYIDEAGGAKIFSFILPTLSLFPNRQTLSTHLIKKNILRRLQKAFDVTQNLIIDGLNPLVPTCTYKYMELVGGGVFRHQKKEVKNIFDSIFVKIYPIEDSLIF